MDINFHFDVTYTAAVAAGFAPPDALFIARVARYVDEDPATCQSFWTLAIDTVWDTFAGDYSKVVEILNIWPVFHFLPGKYGRIVEEVESGLIGHNDPRFELAPLLICGTESDLTAALVSDAATAYAGGATYEYKLSRIGIAMHTLADTFAHQGFAGLPLACINEVSAVKTATDRTNLHQKAYMPAINYSPAPSGDSFGFLGHGRIGHLPDKPGATFQYKAAWRKPTNPYITRYNPLEFFCAYLQMLEAMQSILTPGTVFLNSANRDGIVAALRVSGTSIVEPYIRAFANALEDKQLKGSWYSIFKGQHAGLAAYGAVDPTFTVASPAGGYIPLNDDPNPALLAEFRRAAVDQATLVTTSSPGLRVYIDYLAQLQR